MQVDLGQILFYMTKMSVKFAQICHIGVPLIMNFPYNELIFAVPWHCVKSGFHCTKKLTTRKALNIIALSEGSLPASGLECHFSWYQKMSDLNGGNTEQVLYQDLQREKQQAKSGCASFTTSKDRIFHWIVVDLDLNSF